MSKTKFRKGFLAVIFVMFLMLLISCGGGGGSSSSSSSLSADQTGVFVDSPVANAPYEVIYNGEIIHYGTTDDNGTFRFNERARVKFYLDNAKKFAFGEIEEPKPVITPQDFVGEDNLSAGFILSALLQYLDSDNDPSNGIQIDTNKVNNIVSALNTNQNIVNQIDDLKSIDEVKDKLDDAVMHFSSFNLYGRYNTDNTTGKVVMLPNELTATNSIVYCDGGKEKIYVKLDTYFFANKGYGVFQSLFEDNSTEYEFITLLPQEYVYNPDNGTVEIKLKGEDKFDADYDITVTIDTSNPDEVTFKIEDPDHNCGGEVKLYRVTKPAAADCSNINLNGDFEVDNITELANCDINDTDNYSGVLHDSQINCEYSVPCDDTGVLTIVQNDCKLDMTFTDEDGDTQTFEAYLIPGTNSFFFLEFDNITDENGNPGISPNLMKCEYSSTSKIIKCYNVYIDAYQNVGIDEFAYEELYWRKK